MGRQERRLAERRNRIENRKGKIPLSRKEIKELKDTITHDASAYSVEALMTCYALALRRLYGFGHKRILRSLQAIDGLMGEILDDKATIENYKKILEDETGIIIRCDD